MIDGAMIQTLIVGHLWQSVALAAVLAGALIFGRRMRGTTRYGLAAMALAASIVLPLAAFIPGDSFARTLLDKLGAPAAVAEKAAAPETGPSFIEKAAAENGVPMWQVELASNAINAAMQDGAVPASETALGKTAIEGGAPAWAIDLGSRMLRNSVELAPAPEPQPLFTLPEIKLPDLNLPDLTLPLLMVWIAGALFLLTRTVRDLLAVERLVANARPANLPDKLKSRMEGVRVAVSPDAPGPMAAGLFRPCIVLPENIALNSPGMAALLEHERAHIERKDMAVALLQRVTLALLWWSPALYWISRRIDEEREVACDDAAVEKSALSSRPPYQAADRGRQGRTLCKVFRASGFRRAGACGCGRRDGDAALCRRCSTTRSHTAGRRVAGWRRHRPGVATGSRFGTQCF
jgi:hypothetical protein